jgi:hypothetical protein
VQPPGHMKGRHGSAGQARLCQALTPRVLRVSAPDNALQSGNMASVGGSPGLGEAKPDPLPGVAYGATLRDVAGIGERGDVLAEGGLADVEQGQQGAELDLAHRIQGRADPQPDRGVDQVVEPACRQ